MSIINFYRKQTVLNDILKNQNVVIVDNSQLNNAINTNTTSQYSISNTLEIESGIDYQNYSNYLTKLYMSHYNVRTPLISNKDIIENIKRYNNCEYTITGSNQDNYDFGNTLIQNGKYTNYDHKNVVNSLLLNHTYNKLYYIQPNKVNLMSYLLDIKNGFNYNYDNHVLYFNIDNNYIHSINNTLYYNFNKVRETSNNDNGITLLDNKYINTKNVSHYELEESKYYGVMDINKDFKYNTFITLNKLKTLYNKCEDVYNTLSYYVTIDDYNNDYFEFLKYHYKKNIHTRWYLYDRFMPELEGEHEQWMREYIAYYNIAYDIRFEDTKLYLTDTELGISNLDISDEKTIYISDLNNVSFNIYGNTSYINSYNYTYFKSNNLLKVENNNIDYKLSYIHDYKYLTSKIINNFIETSSTIFENQVKTNIIQVIKDSIIKYPTNTQYNIIIDSNIDKNIFNNSGLTIKYISSPYLDKYMVEEDLDIHNENNMSYITYINYQSRYGITITTHWTSYINNFYNHERIILPIPNELNIRKITGKIQGYYKPIKLCHRYTFDIYDDDLRDNQYSYYILSSKKLINFLSNQENENSINAEKISIDLHISNNAQNINTNQGNHHIIPGNLINNYIFNIKDNNEKFIYLRTNRIYINDDLFNELKSKKLLISQKDIDNLCYYKILAPDMNYEYYPILDSYPNKYINDKFFESKIFNIDEYQNVEEFDTCISNIKNIYYDDINDNKLYIYEILVTDCTQIEANLLDTLELEPKIYYEIIYYTLVNSDGEIIDGENKKISSLDKSHINESNLQLYDDGQINKSNIFNTQIISGQTYEYLNLYKYLSLYLNHSIKL